jgi:hypothetical protein
LGIRKGISLPRVSWTDYDRLLGRMLYAGDQNDLALEENGYVEQTVRGTSMLAEHLRENASPEEQAAESLLPARSLPQRAS